MDIQEAKNILQACRPDNSEDRADPLIADALKLAESEPELMAWFEAEQDFDRQMCDEFDTIYPPSELKASILAGMRAHHAAAQKAKQDAQKDTAQSTIETAITFKTEEDSKPRSTSIATTTRSWWARPSVAIAAVIAVLFAVIMIPRSGISPQPSQSSDTQLALAGVPNIIQFLSSQIQTMPQRGFEKESHDVGPLKAYLVKSGAPVPDSMPERFQNMPTMGCITFNYEGNKISMICFNGAEVCHLITMDRQATEDSFTTQAQRFEHGGYAFKVWIEGEKIMILCVKGTDREIPEFI